MMTPVYSCSVGIVQLAREKLRRAAQAAQGIFDLVGELPNHQAAALQAREQVALARDALALGCIGKLEQQMRAGDLPFQQSDRDVEHARIARRAGGFQHQLAIGDPFSGLEHAAQGRDESVGFVQEISERPAARLLQAEGEHILRRNVGVDRAQLCIEYDDAG
jgi:hypothetical protein